MIPVKSEAALKTIILGEVYRWGDMTTFLGLEHVLDLDLESRRKTLFGRCDVEQHIVSVPPGSAILFETYINLVLPSSDITKIYFPSCFIMCSSDLREKFGTAPRWSKNRKHSVACVMNQPRYPRLITSCWLANNVDLIDFVYTQHWDPDERIAALYELLQIGGMKDWTNDWGPRLLQLPESRVGIYDKNLVNNFAMLYDEVYSQAASAIVMSAVCWEHGAELEEKYLHAVLSGCIPIVQGYGIYDRLGLLGFDTFEDLIDTSSQWDTNPITAAWNLCEHNRDFFTGAKDIVADPAIQDRLRHNFELAQDFQRLSHNVINALNDISARDLWYQHRLWHHLSWTKRIDLPWDQWFKS